MQLETILYEKQDGVATITLNRPDRHNAFNLAMAHELKDVWAEVKKDPEVVCVIVTGAGERAFCTGMDVADVASGSAREQSQRIAVCAITPLVPTEIDMTKCDSGLDAERVRILLEVSLQLRVGGIHLSGQILRQELHLLP